MSILSYLYNNKKNIIRLFIGLLSILYVVLYFTNFNSSQYLKYSTLIYITFFIVYLFSEIIIYYNPKIGLFNTMYNNIKRISLILISIGIIFFILYKISTNENISYFISTIIILFIIFFTLYILFIIVNNTKFVNLLKQNKYFKILYHLVFLIPCIIYDPNFLKNDYKKTPTFIYIILLFQLFILGTYFSWDYILKKIKIHDKTQIFSGPVYLNNEKTIGTYENLHLSDITNDNNSTNLFTYKYALELDLFIDNKGSNYNELSNEYVPVFSYGDKPQIQYNISENKLRIITKRNNNNIEIIYENNDIPLQNWNNIVINYNSGIFDVFLNKKLVGTSKGNIFYMKYDTITIGSDNGIAGGIRNIHYHKNKNLII
jgi:hypothetical protein